MKRKEVIDMRGEVNVKGYHNWGCGALNDTSPCSCEPRNDGVAIMLEPSTPDNGNPGNQGSTNNGTSIKLDGSSNIKPEAKSLES